MSSWGSRQKEVQAPPTFGAIPGHVGTAEGWILILAKSLRTSVWRNPAVTQCSCSCRKAWEYQA